MKGERRCRYAGNAATKGKAGIGLRIGVHLKRRGWIKNNSVHCGALCIVKNSPEINISLSGERHGKSGL